MIPKRVTVENFLSFGPKTEIHFADDEPLWVLGGPNGIGKSAVFDAMTYCLFAQHRGGAGDADSLIRHGSDGFGVSFEFEFAGEDYLITRNRRRGARPTQSVERRSEGRWKSVPQVDSVADVKDWVIRTTGLNFDSFQASILLRQGDAEVILDATGKERMTILKGVIGLDAYEGVSKRIGEDAKAKKAELKSLALKRDAMAEISADDLEAVRLDVERCAAGKAGAAAAQETALAGVNHARTWEESEPKRRDLEDKLKDADGRAADAERIRREHAELAELAAVLPTLRQFVPLRAKLPVDERKVAASVELRESAEAERVRLDAQSKGADAGKAALEVAVETHGREAAASRKEIASRSRFLKAAQEMAELAAKVAAFPPSLGGDCADAEGADRTAKEALTGAEAARTEQETLLKQALTRQSNFANLAVGVSCSACGQLVDAAHAEKERGLAGASVDALRLRSAECGRLLATAKESARSASALRSDLDGKLRDRDTLTATLADKRRDLESYGGTSDAVLLQNQIGAHAAAAESAERAAAGAKAELGALGATLAALVRDLRAATAGATESADRAAEADKQLADARTRCATFSEQLSENRRDTTPERLAELIGIAEKHSRNGVADEFEKLQYDEARRGEWRSRRAELAAQIDAIPPDERRPMRDAELDCDRAKKSRLAADAAWQLARDALAELERRAEAFAKLGAELAAAEFATRIAAKLHDLLGNAGLLRELVRIAEWEIVRFGNDTLQKLSEGELTLELSAESKTDDEALVLVVRRPDSASPIPVAYLSGSQKFRVALAIALGIGQFASGQARPLECVIIDEGFGSLDKEGLRAAAEELNRLKRHLRRIILVSHQEEFTDHFPVVIQLKKTADGVTATPVRR